MVLYTTYHEHGPLATEKGLAPAWLNAKMEEHFHSDAEVNRPNVPHYPTHILQPVEATPLLDQLRRQEACSRVCSGDSLSPIVFYVFSPRVF